MPVSKVIIIGAGFAGPALALLLKKSNPSIDLTIYEIREQPPSLGGAINLTCNGLRILDQLGLYQELEAESAETPEFECFNAAGKKFGAIRTGNVTKEKYGYGTLRVMRTVIHGKLLKRLGDEGIIVKWGMNLKKIDEETDSVKCIFADGTVDSCDMLVGADGIHSMVRSLRVDPVIEPTYTGLSAIYSIVNVKALKTPVFFSGNFGFVWTAEGMFAAGYCDKKKENMYWFNTHTVEPRDREGWTLHGQELENIKSEVMKRLKGADVPFMKELVENSPDMRFYPTYRLPLGGRWFTRRCILIGDAAHAMTTHIGQGTSAALEDTVILTRLLEKNEDLLTAFKKFDKIRRPRIQDLFHYANRAGNMRRIQGPWSYWIQEKILSFVLNYVPERYMIAPFEYDASTVNIDVTPD